MICSTGTHTPKSGVYTIPGRWAWGLMQGNVYGQYVTKITGNILFHSVPYTKQNPSTLEYWEYDKLGTAASLGCVRLKVEDSKWIYENCPNGTQVEFYSNSDPGPLGKPTAKKISEYPDYLKGWDPTDPNPQNPWHNYKEEVPSEMKNEIKNETENKEQNEVKNETQNEVKNEIKNEIKEENKNEIKNKTENKIINENKNEMKNETEIYNVNENKSIATNEIKNIISNKI